jgi:hypothetical protein
MLFTSPNLLGQPATSSVQSRHSYLHQPQSLPHQQSSSFLHQPPIAATSSVSQGGFLLTSVPIATTSSSVQSFPNKHVVRMPQVFFRDVAHYFPPRVKRELVPTPTRKPKGRTLSTTEPALVPSFPLLVLLPIFLDPSAIS